MTRSKKEIEILLELGYDPNDPSYSVETYNTATVTEQKETLRMNEDMEKRVGQYVAVRDRIDELKTKHEEELRKPKEMLEKLAGIIHKFLDDNNLKNLRTDAGSCYVSTRWTANVQDADAFMKFVIENQQFDLLERRAKAEAVKTYVADHNMLPTGVSLNALSSVGVRRPTGKSKS